MNQVVPAGSWKIQAVVLQVLASARKLTLLSLVRLKKVPLTRIQKLSWSKPYKKLGNYSTRLHNLNEADITDLENVP